MWLVAAWLSALFAGLTSILAKCGIKDIDSDVATAIRTIVVLLFSWLMVFVCGSFSSISSIKMNTLLFLILSGLATGGSWICYFKALSIGNVNKVVPVDKSSTIITILLAIVLFKEVDHLVIKLISTLIIGIGIFLMIEKKRSTNVEQKGWMKYAVLSAVFASMSAILAKVGIFGVESNLATAIRTSVVLVMAWFIVFIKNKTTSLNNINKKELLYIVLSGLATGASWLCYYYAIGNGLVSVVVPIDKLSIVVSIIFSYLVFKETLTKKSFIGLMFMIIGTLIMTLFG